MRLLLAEDDRMLGESLTRNLGVAGYAVDWIRDGGAGIAAAEAASYDLAVLDLGLPVSDGFSVLQALRKGGQTTPVLILTARDETADRVHGLDAGADDYMVKPFDFDELLARLRALARRHGGRCEPCIEFRGLTMDPAKHEVTYNGEPVALTRREFALLHALLEHPGQVWTRERLIERLYGFDEGIASNALEVYIHALRRKLSPDCIVSVRGVGYAMKSA